MSARKFCGRSLEGGPGTCHSWWDGCPEKTAHCFNRFVTENGGQIDLAKAREWEAERDKAREPQRALL